MYVRLAFAVAAHLEPEILVVDEVLAVGDVEFQKKCLGKMEDISSEGRTIFFVSHNMAAISSLCPTTLLLDHGRVALYEDTQSAIHQYLKTMENRANKPILTRTDRKGTGVAKFSYVLIENSLGKRLTTIKCGDSISIKSSYQAYKTYSKIKVQIAIYNEINQRVLSFDSEASSSTIDNWPERGTVTCRLLDAFPLTSGRYKVNIAIHANGVLADNIGTAYVFDVIEGDFFGAGKLPTLQPIFLAKNEWDVDSEIRT
jgi:lipopolysaccharide transport system ATP-binding protein